MYAQGDKNMKKNMKIFSITAICFVLLAVPLVLSSGLIDTPKFSMENAASTQTAQQTPNVFVDPSKISGNYGWDLGFNISDTFQVHANISDVTDLYTWNVNLTWNPTVLNFTRIVAYGDLLAQTTSPFGTSRIADIMRVSNETGHATVAESVLGDYSGVNGSGQLVTIEFLIVDYGSTDLTIRLNGTLPTKLLDSTGETITFTVVDGYFTNIAPTGDVNDDGIVNIFDLTIVSLSYGCFQGEPGYNPDADLNEDGIVDMRDLVIVARNLGRTAL